MITKDIKITTHIGSLSVKSIMSAKILDPNGELSEAQKPKAIPYKGICYHLHAGYSRDIKATADQMLYVKRKDILDNFGEPQWMSVRDIQVGDYICYPIIVAQNEPDLAMLQDENIFYLLGRYAADGYALYDSIVVAGNANPRMMVALNKLNVNSRYDNGNTLVESKALRRWCVEHIGKNNKTIDTTILCLKNKYLRFFIEGYVDGSSETFEGGIVFIAKSYNIAIGLAQCIAKVYNLPTKIRPYTYVDNDTIVEYNVIMPTGNISDESVDCDSKGMWYRVKSKHPLEIDAKMYSIDGTYIANNLITKENEKEKFF